MAPWCIGVRDKDGRVSQMACEMNKNQELEEDWPRHTYLGVLPVHIHKAFYQQRWIKKSVPGSMSNSGTASVPLVQLPFHRRDGCLVDAYDMHGRVPLVPLWWYCWSWKGKGLKIFFSFCSYIFWRIANAFYMDKSSHCQPVTTLRRSMDNHTCTFEVSG